MPRHLFRNDFRILTGIACLLIALFVGAIGLTIWSLRDDAIRDANNDTGNVATILSGQFDRSIEAVDAVLGDVRDLATARIDGGSLSEIRQFEFYERLRDQLGRLPEADVAAIIGSDGKVASSTTQWPPTGTDVSDRDYFNHLKHDTTGKIYVSKLMPNRVSGVKTVFLTKRISGPNNEFLGLALIGIKLAYFENIYHSIKSLQNQSFVLLHPDGTVLVRYPDSADRSNQKIPADSSWHQLIAAGGGNYRSPGYFDKEARYVSVRPLQNYPLVVNVAMTETAALATWYYRTTMIGAGALFALICSAFLLRLFAAREKSLVESTKNLIHLAHFDQLTGLANRISLHQDLKDAILPAKGTAAATSIAMFDLDGFKDINDTLGHSVGDQLLREVARRMTAFLPANGRFYRLGGDEFVLVLNNCGDPVEAVEKVEGMLRQLATQFHIGGHNLFVGASVGIAIAPSHGRDVEELLSNADLALYDAKSAGGNIARVFTPVLRAKAHARRSLEIELRRACFNNEFELFYQPQIRTSDHEVVGVEALLRWRHPERGLLAPGVFIDALSVSAVVAEVGRWILRTACTQAAAWRSEGLPLRMGVNLFPAQFHNNALLHDVEKALEDSGLPAEALEIEITENIALGEQEESLNVLRALRAKGVQLAFDDFGTGYASLSYLTRYPLTRLKIDQSFVRKIAEDSSLEETAIVRSIIVMAHNLGLEVIAEGVETTAQANFLAAEKCEELQGYLFAKPLPAAELEAYFRNSTATRQGPAPAIQYA
jgi:diguanylate cyclase (GGDEF)-like protein